MLSEGLVKKDGKIWVGDNVGLQTKLIQAFHSTVIGGHSRVHATYQRLKNLLLEMD